MTAAPVMMTSSAAPAPVTPLPGRNQVDALGIRSGPDMARRIVESHRAGLMSRRQRDLLSEKYLLHIDGSGDFQWADIWMGQRIEIPRDVSGFRKTENVLRIVVDNAVAHHTTMPLRYFSERTSDRQSRDRALVDMLWINHLAEQQDFNGLFSDALYMAMASGFCPVHRYWREDTNDNYEPVGYGIGDPLVEQAQKVKVPQGGMIDCWVGNPFDTVFDLGAKRGSIRSVTYGRVLPAQQVRDAFGHIPGVKDLQGSTRIPSADVFQRIARNWSMPGLGVHGSPVAMYRRKTEGNDEELLTVICREVLPGVDAAWPEGRLQCVAVPGEVDLLRGQGAGGSAIMLADQPLPARDFSFSLFYSHHRSDDVHGKPWVEDIDQLQVDLNIAKSTRWETIQKMKNSPIVAPGGAIDQDMLDLGDYQLLELEPTASNWMPRVMEWPAQILTALDKEIAELRSAIYTGGGYQAASRGEAPGSRIAYRAIVALQQADNSIHGPVNMRFKRSACDFARGCWRQMKAYGDVAWLVESTGDEYGYLSGPYIDNTKLSNQPPTFKLVNAFGPSPELRAQEILELMGTRGADGEPFLRTEEARRLYPNPMVFDVAGDPKVVQRRRAKTIASKIHEAAQRFREQTGFDQTDPANPWVQQAAKILFGQLEATYPRLRDDDLQAHLDSLSEITQDETADAIARLAAQMRQAMYYQWQEQMAAMAVAPGRPVVAAPAGARPGPQGDRRAIAAQVQSGGRSPEMMNEEGPRQAIAATAR